MAPVDVAISGTRNLSQGIEVAKLTITNPSDHIAFFLRIEVTKGRNGREVLPVTYDDNYLTVFPHESETINARFRESDLEGQQPALKLEGWNVRERMGALDSMRGNVSAGTSSNASGLQRKSENTSRDEFTRHRLREHRSSFERRTTKSKSTAS
jgi:hypothetical protein